jgi:hypothetical protein
MAIVSYQIANFSRYAIPQDSGLTCWAACAAMLKSVKAQKRVSETDTFSSDAYRAYRDKRSVSYMEIKKFYGELGFQFVEHIDVSSRPAVAQLIIKNAPLIVCSKIVQFGAQPTFTGSHVRIVYGCWGDPDADQEDAFQVRIFDPWPQEGFQPMTSFLFSHFKFQMTWPQGDPYVGMTFYN